MKKKYMITTLAVLALTFTACQKEDSPTAWDADPDAVRIEVTAGVTYTRSYPLGNAEEQKYFAQGDRISVLTQNQHEAIFQSDGMKWAPATDSYLKWTAEKMTFQAYYPYTGNDRSSYTDFTVPTDQSGTNDNNTIVRADYMTGTAVDAEKGADNTVSFQMERRMTLIEVKIAGYNNQYENGETVTDLKIRSTKSFSEQDEVIITPYHSTDSWYAIIIPGFKETTPFVNIEMSNGEQLTARVPTNMTFEKGKKYTFNITVGRKKVFIKTVEVYDWFAGVPMDDGTAV